MALEAVHDPFLRTNRASSLTKYVVKHDLHTALNQSDTTVLDIARWHWQIADIAYKGYRMFAKPVYSIDPRTVLIDTKGNVVFKSVFRYDKDLPQCSDVMAAISILSIHTNIILSASSNSEIDRSQLKIFETLADHILYNNDLNSAKNVVAAAYIKVDNLCQLIEGGLLDDLHKIAKQLLKKRVRFTV